MGRKYNKAFGQKMEKKYGRKSYIYCQDILKENGGV